MSLFGLENAYRNIFRRGDSESAIKFNYVLSQLKLLKWAYLGLKMRIGINLRGDSESAIKLNYVLSQLKLLKWAYLGLSIYWSKNSIRSHFRCPDLNEKLAQRTLLWAQCELIDEKWKIWDISNFYRTQKNFPLSQTMINSDLWTHYLAQKLIYYPN